jgi:hypothetical protein
MLDDLISDFQLSRRYGLLLIHLLEYCLHLSYCLAPIHRIKSIQPVHHMSPPRLLVLLNLITKHLFLVTLQKLRTVSRLHRGPQRALLNPLVVICQRLHVLHIAKVLIRLRVVIVVLHHDFLLLHATSYLRLHAIAPPIEEVTRAVAVWIVVTAGDEVYTLIARPVVKHYS